MQLLKKDLMLRVNTNEKYTTTYFIIIYGALVYECCLTNTEEDTVPFSGRLKHKDHTHCS